MNDEPRTIKLRYLDITNEMIKEQIIYTATERDTSSKWAALKILGIEPLNNQTPMRTYLKYLSDLNGLPFTLPVHRDLADVLSRGEPARFLWWLA